MSPHELSSLFIHHHLVQATRLCTPAAMCFILRFLPMIWPIRRQRKLEDQPPATVEPLQAPRRQFSITLFGDVHSHHHSHVAYSFNSGNLYSSNVNNRLTDNSSTVVRDLFSAGVELGKSWPHLLVDLLFDSWYSDNEQDDAPS